MHTPVPVRAEREPCESAARRQQEGHGAVYLCAFRLLFMQIATWHGEAEVNEG